MNAVWPGPVFEFKPDYKCKPTEDIRSINDCILAVAGTTPEATENQSPLYVLNWAKTAHAQLMARAVTRWGAVVTSTNVPHFKGSNESSTALALKAHLASWVNKTDSDAVMEFEYAADEDDQDVDETAEEWEPPKRRRIDLHVKGIGCFEVESMRGSGPMESFYHRKIFSRVKKDIRFFLIVPGEAILWAGPYLSDLAHHLSETKRSRDGSRGGRNFPRNPWQTARLLSQWKGPLHLKGSNPERRKQTALEGPIRLEDVAGYEEVRRKIDELIVWPEKHGKVLRPTSRSSGVLFFGPPGCGKSRWARAIAGELEQEVRLLAPPTCEVLISDGGRS